MIGGPFHGRELPDSPASVMVVPILMCYPVSPDESHEWRYSRQTLPAGEEVWVIDQLGVLRRREAAL